MKTEIKQIPLDGTPFQANGKTYHVSNELTIERWVKMQEFQIELGFGVEFAEMQQNWLKINDFANKQKFTDIAVMAHNMVNGISKTYSREPQILKYCALFINYEGEDLAIINDEMISTKIADWKAEGLGIDGFFLFSLGKVNGLADVFMNATHEDSGQTSE